MLRNITITLSEEAARWARLKAAEQATSVSKLVGRMIEDQMRRGDDYWQAYETWKAIRPSAAKGAATRMSRDQAHARR
ncbi:MAG: hypothetical protein SFV54_24760 [Bryobacteraceae bacterium]|nr:hypothetical protein [Bryobacteraceae bacterium]